MNRLLYSEGREVLERWLKTEKWNSQQSLEFFLEILEDLHLSQMVYNKPKEEEYQEKDPMISFRGEESNEEEEKVMEDSESEEEKEMNHGMEEISKPIKLTFNQKTKLSTSEKEGVKKLPQPRIYHRKDDEFMSFVSLVLYHLLCIDYQLKINGKTGDTVTSLMTKSWQKEENQDPLNQNHIKDTLEQEEESIEEATDQATLEQLQLEDDGIEIGSETTTECSEYSEDLYDDEDIDQIILKVITRISTTFCKLFEYEYRHSQSDGVNKVLVEPTSYLMNEKIDVKDFISYFNDWMERNHPNEDKSFPMTDKFLAKDQNSYSLISSAFLIKIKFNQFKSLDAKAQIKFLKTLTRRTMKLANFQKSDFAEDIIIEILSNIRDPPKVDKIVSQTHDGLWGSFFYPRPSPQPHISLEEQYNQPEWLEKAKNYERAIDAIHRILTQSKMDTLALSCYKDRRRSNNSFSVFIRSILKPEIGNPLKTVKLGELKREDFLPFKIDRGYRVKEIDIGEIDYGDAVYSFEKAVFDSDIGEDKLFYVEGRNSICTRTNLKKTRDELIEIPDEYYFEEDDNEAREEGEEDNQLAVNAAILQRQRRRRAQEDSGYEDKDNKNQAQNKKQYFYKNYTLLSFKKRGDNKLIRSEKFDKLDNRVSTDMLRSGSAIIRRMRHANDQDEQGFGTYVNGIAVNELPNFIRKPLYYMHVPERFQDHSFCTKFSTYWLTHWAQGFANIAGGWIPQDQLEDNDYPCLYVKRLKKVVLRGKLFTKDLTKQFRMLTAHRIHSNQKVVNFDDPEQREPYYSRLFELKAPLSQRYKHREPFDPDRHILPALNPSPALLFLTDFTTRTKKVVKADSLFRRKGDYCSNNPIKYEPNQGGEVMGQSEREFFVDKIMKRGEWSQFLAVEQNQYPSFVWRDLEGFNHDVRVYERLYTNTYSSNTVFDEEQNMFICYKIDTQKRRSDGLHKHYVHKKKFESLKSLCEEDKERVHFQVSLKGSKKLFRLGVRAGTQIALHAHFRRLFLLDWKDNRAELRVLSYDAIAKCIKKYL